MRSRFNPFPDWNWPKAQSKTFVKCCEIKEHYETVSTYIDNHRHPHYDSSKNLVLYFETPYQCLSSNLLPISGPRFSFGKRGLDHVGSKWPVLKWLCMLQGHAGQPHVAWSSDGREGREMSHSRLESGSATALLSVFALLGEFVWVLYCIYYCFMP